MAARKLKKIVIAVDGASACGKSSTCREVARVIGYKYFDSGAMYRAFTYYLINTRVVIANENEVIRALDDCNISFQMNKRGETFICVDAVNVENEIRRPYISAQVSSVSALPYVRERLVSIQRTLGKKKGIIMDGRDIGTAVFPDAELKIYMTADLQARANRRQKELGKQLEVLDIDKVKASLYKRDFLDSTRKESPLIMGKDAILLDTTHITLDEQVDKIVNYAISKIISLC